MWTTAPARRTTHSLLCAASLLSTRMYSITVFIRRCIASTGIRIGILLSRGRTRKLALHAEAGAPFLHVSCLTCVVSVSSPERLAASVPCLNASPFELRYFLAHLAPRRTTVFISSPAPCFCIGRTGRRSEQHGWGGRLQRICLYAHMAQPSAGGRQAGRLPPRSAWHYPAQAWRVPVTCQSLRYDTRLRTYRAAGIIGQQTNWWRSALARLGAVLLGITNRCAARCRPPLRLSPSATGRRLRTDGDHPLAQAFHRDSGMAPFPSTPRFHPRRCPRHVCSTIAFFCSHTYAILLSLPSPNLTTGFASVCTAAA